MQGYIGLDRPLSRHICREREREIHIYIYICICICAYIYIYMCIGREGSTRGSERVIWYMDMGYERLHGFYGLFWVMVGHMGHVLLYGL